MQAEQWRSHCPALLTGATHSWKDVHVVQGNPLPPNCETLGDNDAER